MIESIRVVDSHTGGEPTRVVVSGGPELGVGDTVELLQRFSSEFDHYRSAVVNEPRGSDVMVGALLLEPADPANTAGIIFFNNVGYLGMCGHGMIGVVATLAHLGRIAPGAHWFETPVGVVQATLESNGEVSITNVTSWRERKDVQIDVPGVGQVTGDIAYGGNWFYLIGNHGQDLSPGNIESLTDYCWRVRQAINAQGHPEVDHVELFAAPSDARASSRNFVLCPGKAYDRSPCGTGTSAKLACLAADGLLHEGQVWTQESIIGSCFEASFSWVDKDQGHIAPTLRGSAYVSGEGTLLLDPADPFCWGIPAK